MDPIQQLAEECDALRSEAIGILEKGGPEYDIEQHDAERVQQVERELAEKSDKLQLMRQRAGLKEKYAAEREEARRVTGRAPFPTDERSDAGDADTKRGYEYEPPPNLGDLFIKSEAYTGFNFASSRGPAIEVPVDVKTMLSTSAGFAPALVRGPRVVDLGQPALTLLDLIPSATINQPAVIYMQETTNTNAAAEIAEAGAYPEGAFVWTEVSTPVRKIGEILPVTLEALEDSQGMRDRIQNRLLLHVRQRLNNQILNGSGIAPNLAGILATSGILTQAMGTDSPLDAVYLAILKEQTTDFSNPDAVVMNPADWGKVRMMQTADGVYIYGPPSDTVVPRLWGLPVILSTYLAAGTALVGDFSMFAEIDYKPTVEFEISTEHTDNWSHDILAMKARIRAALAIYRPSAFCKITGLAFS